MEKRIINIIERITGNTFPEANFQSNIITDFGIDSLQMVTFFLNLEDEFQISIDFENFNYENLSSIEKTIKYINDQVD